MIKTLIIDDEQDAVSGMQMLLEEYCKSITLVGTASDLVNGIKEIKAKQPDLVFMDVEMQNHTGFDILDCITDVNFLTIFVTGHNEHAIKAIKANAFDYLLKPVDIDELQRSVARVEQKKDETWQPRGAGTTADNLKIPLSTNDGFYYLSCKDILHLKAEGSYTTVHCKDDKTYMVSKNLKEFETMLQDKGFFRVHNSHIINIQHITKYLRTDGGYVVLSDNSKVEISRNRKDAFFQQMGVS